MGKWPLRASRPLLHSPASSTHSGLCEGQEEPVLHLLALVWGHFPTRRKLLVREKALLQRLSPQHEVQCVCPA
ncbi:MAG: hypothetical protein ACI9OU_001863 [Candidatus Promineifilaceae bacterium]|jgi:hypothetical protein